MEPEYTLTGLEALILQCWLEKKTVDISRRLEDNDLGILGTD